MVTKAAEEASDLLGDMSTMSAEQETSMLGKIKASLFVQKYILVFFPIFWL